MAAFAKPYRLVRAIMGLRLPSKHSNQSSLRTFIRLLAPFALTILGGISVFASAENIKEQTTNSKVNSNGVITIGILGDSLSAGYGLKPDETWVHHIENTFKELARFPKTRFINASVSGATTDAGIQMLPALLNQKPDIVILELGANDGLQGKPLPLIYQNLTQLITQIKGTGADILLLGIRLPPNLGKRYTEPFHAQFQSLATSFELAYIPFFLEDVAGKQEFMQGDGLHPNALAQPIIAERVFPELKGLVLKSIKQQK